MKVLLIDVDSKIPNLALMKISAYHKSRGDDVGFNIDEPDKIYVSIIFEKNAKNLNGIKFLYPDAEIVMGGAGHDISSRLPDGIEFLKPDYDLYPDCDYSMGYTTRGCIRKCYFCIIPQKEGSFRKWQHPSKFHDERFETINLMDNNWLAGGDWFWEVSRWIRDHDLKLRVEQGMDIRLMTLEIASELRKHAWSQTLTFAFDNDEDREAVLRGIALLKGTGFDLKREVQFFVYVDSDTQFQSGLDRCQLLRQCGTNAFVMFNCRQISTKRIRHLQRWANRRWAYWACDFEDYNPSYDDIQYLKVEELKKGVDRNQTQVDLF